MIDYPEDWRQIADAVKERAGWRCVRCGHRQERPGEPAQCDQHCQHKRDGKQRVLTVHHLDGDKNNSEWWNLAALCQVCHLHVQAAYHPDQIPLFELESWLVPYHNARLGALSPCNAQTTMIASTKASAGSI